MTLGERIKLLRLHRGLTQVELANAVGISKQNLYKYENGIITNIPSEKIEALAHALSVSPSHLMGWTDGGNGFSFTEEDGSFAFLFSFHDNERPTANILRIAGRDGSFTERKLTDEQIDLVRRMIDQMPDFED